MVAFKLNETVFLIVGSDKEIKKSRICIIVQHDVKIFAQRYSK